MGILSWIRDWRNKRRKEKELAAIDYLRNSLNIEKSRITKMTTLVTTIENLLKQHKFTEAEKWIPVLAKEMAIKKTTDKMEEKDWKYFKKTIFKDLKEQMQGIK